MSYFFVDGQRDGKPAQALYIQADNEEAAKARAAQLGMQATGVRAAKAIPNLKSPPTWPLYVFTGFMYLMCFVETIDARISGNRGFKASTTMLTTIPPIIFCILQHLKKSQQRQQELQAEINDLRAHLASHNLLGDGSA